MTPACLGKVALFVTGTATATLLAADPPEEPSESAYFLAVATLLCAATGAAGWLTGRGIEYCANRDTLNASFARRYETEVEQLQRNKIWPMVRERLPPSLDDVAALCRPDRLNWARRVRHYFVDGLADAGHSGGVRERWKPERVQQCRETIKAAIGEVRAKAPRGWSIPSLSYTEGKEVESFIHRYVASDVSILASPEVTGKECARVRIYLVARPYVLGGNPREAMQALLNKVRTGQPVESVLKDSGLDWRLVNRGGTRDVKLATAPESGTGTASQTQVQFRSDSRDVHADIEEKLRQQMADLPDHVVRFIEKSEALLGRGKGSRASDSWVLRVSATSSHPAYDLRVRRDGDSNFILESCRRVT